MENTRYPGNADEKGKVERGMRREPVFGFWKSILAVVKGHRVKCGYALPVITSERPIIHSKIAQEILRTTEHLLKIDKLKINDTLPCDANKRLPVIEDNQIILSRLKYYSKHSKIRFYLNYPVLQQAYPDPRIFLNAIDQAGEKK